MNNDINQPQGSQPTGGLGLPPLPSIPETPTAPPPPEPILPAPLPTLEPIAPPTPPIEEKPKEEGVKPVKPKRKISKKLAIGGTLVLLLLGGAIALAAQFGLFRGDIRQLARYTEVGVGIANITDNSMSVWWVQNKPARGCVTLTQTETQKQVGKCDEKNSYIHLVELTGLEPSSAYRVEMKHGESLVPLSPYWGRAIWTRETGTRHTPEVVTGKVLDAQNRPVSGAMVFVAPGVTERQVIPLVVITNEQGAFSVDLAILKMQFVTPTDPLFVEVTSGNGLKLFERRLDRATPSSFPDIITGTP